MSRRGSRWSLRLGFAVYPAALAALAVAPSLAWLSGVLVVWAAANSIVDVAMNAAGVELERRLRRPLLSRLHAGQSGGLLAGGLAATVAASVHLSLAVHFGVVAAAGAAAALAATTRVPARPGGRAAPRTRVRADRRLLLLGTVAFCAFLIDGGATSWAAVDLRTEHRAPAAVAAAGYTLFTVAMVLCRLLGDRALSRFARARIVRACGVIAAAGATGVVLAPTAAVAMTGWAVTGAGLAMLAPVVLGAAPGRATGTPPAAAIASVTTLGYLGSFTGPPVIGGLAGAIGLSAALGLLAAAAALAALLAPFALGPQES